MPLQGRTAAFATSVMCLLSLGAAYGATNLRDRANMIFNVDFVYCGMRAMRPNALVSVRDSAHNQTDDDSNTA